MMEYEFREPLSVDDKGFYITAGQTQFYLNNKKDIDLVKDPAFYKYYLQCCMYNTIYDMTEKDPNCALIYWDPKLECVSVTFPIGGEVAKKVAELNDFSDDEEEVEEDDDEFGLFE